MGQYQTHRKRPAGFLALSGYTVEEFDALLPYFAEAMAERMRTHRLDGSVRQKRRYVAYQNSPLPCNEDKLFFILVYLKSNNLQSVQGALFNLSQPKAHQWIHTLQPVLQEALRAAGELPVRQMEQLSLEEKHAPIYFHDGTERPIPRPSDEQTQRLYYSGKKKQHTIKNLLLIDLSCKILFLSATVEGKRHDKKLADQTAYALPAGSRLLQDTGFQGFTLPDVTILQPKKKPRKQLLSEIDQALNQWLSSLRSRVEHAIGGVKRYRTLKDELRTWKEGFRDAVFETCCGLHNFRLNFRPWRYPPIQWHLFTSL